MKEGIYLGPPKPGRLFRASVLVVATAATLVSASLWYRSHRQVAGLEAELARLEPPERGSGSDPLATGERRFLALHLRAALDVGVADSNPPSEVLDLVAASLPEDMFLVSLTAATAPPRRSLLLEAIANRPEDVSSLQRRVAGSPLVSDTRLLEERRTAEGGLAVRLQVSLAQPSVP